METNSTTEAQPGWPFESDAMAYVAGANDGFALRTPFSTNPQYLEGWADGHDDYLESRGVPA